MVLSAEIEWQESFLETPWVDAQVDEILDIDGEDGDDDEEEAEGEQEDEYESDKEEHCWYDCPWCKEIWLQEKSRDDHMVICSQRI